MCSVLSFFFFFQAEDGIRDLTVTGVQTCALPISCSGGCRPRCKCGTATVTTFEPSRKAFEPLGERKMPSPPWRIRSEEHTSELQSQSNLVCRLLLEKKKQHSTERVEELLSVIVAR